ncbi:MAG: methyltransferase domain-containing protein [Planctomycetes bacterium]|nr:methyltransferase domain-containing protein [Planctomycetota bacterium]
MSQTAVQRFYRYQACVYDSTRWMILHGRRRAVERLRLQRDSKALVIGCGTGLDFRYFLERLDPERGRLTGVDFSADMLARAERRVVASGWSNVELVQADATELALGRRFHAILFSYSLTMIPEWATAVDRAYAHLQPGGRLVVHDFGTFGGWGPLGPIMRTWLRLNHVETQRPYLDKLNRVFANLETTRWLGGYNFTAVGRRLSDDLGG